MPTGRLVAITSAVTVHGPASPSRRRDRFAHLLRQLSAMTVVGALAGLVVVGEILVHTDGVDFRLLQPAALAIVLFVLIPGIYAAVLTLLSERWLREDSWFLRTSWATAAAPLLTWLVVFPLLPALAAVLVLWLVQDAVRQTTPGRAVLSWRGWPWAARALLLVVFLVSSTRLVGDVTVLT
ncbi:MAG: hypothetical protein JWN88_294 [Frankiales bacterium]|nr:hypothetical protein [Frankiales bacterium]